MTYLARLYIPEYFHGHRYFQDTASQNTFRKISLTVLLRQRSKDIVTLLANSILKSSMLLIFSRTLLENCILNLSVLLIFLECSRKQYPKIVCALSQAETLGRPPGTTTLVPEAKFPRSILGQILIKLMVLQRSGTGG